MIRETAIKATIDFDQIYPPVLFIVIK